MFVIVARSIGSVVKDRTILLDLIARSRSMLLASNRLVLAFGPGLLALSHADNVSEAESLK